MVFNLHKREEAQRKKVGFGLLPALVMVDIFPYSTQDPPPVHGEQADKELTKRLLPESQVYAGDFWLTKLST